MSPEKTISFDVIKEILPSGPIESIGFTHSNFESLEAVGMDADGQIKKIEDLSFVKGSEPWNPQATASGIPGTRLCSRLKPDGGPQCQS